LLSAIFFLFLIYLFLIENQKQSLKDSNQKKDLFLQKKKNNDSNGSGFPVSALALFAMRTSLGARILRNTVPPAVYNCPDFY